MDQDISSTGALQEKIRKARRLLEPSLSCNSGNAEARCVAADDLSRLFRSTDMVAISTQADGRYVFVNDFFLRVTGYRRDEVIGRTSSELGLWIDPNQPGETARLLKERGSLDHYEIQIKIRSGDVLTASTHTEWFEHAGEKFIITITHDIMDIEHTVDALQQERSKLNDITARKQAESSLQESEKRYRVLVETMSDGLVQGENGVITYVNDRLCEMVGYAREEIIGRELAGFLDRESQGLFQDRVDRIRRGELGSFEIQWTRKDGKKISTIASPKPVLDGAGQIKGCFAVIHDITERKSAEEELKNSYEQVRNLSAHLQSVREMERTNIAREIHDELGQALTALKMDIFWVKGKLRRDQKELREKTESMVGLVDKTIKTVKRITVELRPGVLDDLGLTAAIEWQAREFRKRTGISCDIVVHPPTVHPAKEHSTALFRIFQETLTNVARHAGATKVLARLEESDGEIVLTVVDNGKGITRRQIASPKSFGIIGIRERVNFFGGEVKITGSPKKGTALQVTIPRRGREEVLSTSFTGEA